MRYYDNFEVIFKFSVINQNCTIFLPKEQKLLTTDTKCLGASFCPQTSQSLITMFVFVSWLESFSVTKKFWENTVQKSANVVRIKFI
jgi:hypothetical protein